MDQQMISIHAPLTGSDLVSGHRDHRRDDFNPRSPYGERHSERSWAATKMYFNPRSPYGERPIWGSISIPWPTFQSTLPLRGATAWTSPGCSPLPDFNPRSPYGERLVPVCRDGRDFQDFNPRSPYGERHRRRGRRAGKT